MEYDIILKIFDSFINFIIIFLAFSASINYLKFIFLNNLKFIWKNKENIKRFYEKITVLKPYTRI